MRRVTIIRVPEHVLGGPYMLQIFNECNKVVGTRSGIATLERAEMLATEYRHTIDRRAVRGHKVQA
jgi:hypothetical protein